MQEPGFKCNFDWPEHSMVVWSREGLGFRGLGFRATLTGRNILWWSGPERVNPKP